MHDHHGHSHGHGHGHGGGSPRRLAITLGLIAAYMVAEVVGGLLTGSLALLADAGHMLSDAAALGLSLFAARVARRPPARHRSYGYYRAEILAALANGATLLAVSVWVVVEAVRRLGSPPEVLGGAMAGVALGGLLVNLLALKILAPGRSESLNVRGAWLHVMTDALGSVAAVAAGLLVWGFGWGWADPVASILISLLVVYSGWDLLREATAILMESVPKGIDPDAVREALLQVPGAVGVHDLHIWAITGELVSLSAHLVIAEERPYVELLREARHLLHERFGIDHVTLQLEPVGFEERETAF